MSDEADPQPLERQLRREAQRLFANHGRQGSAPAILAEHRRRTQVRRRRLAGVAAVALLGVAGVSSALSRFGADRPESGPVVVARTTDPSPTVRDAAASPKPGAAAAIPGEAPEANLPPADEPFPFAITAPDSEGQAVIAVGVYIPPRVERVHFHDLPPLQQAAVRRVLEIEEDELKPTI